jgi:A/G-specific adenine glycosylase
VSVAGWVARRGRWLAARRPPVGLLGGLWEMPGGDLEAGETPEEAIGRALRERLGLVVKEVRPLGSVSHQFSHRSLELHVLEAAVAEGRVRRAGYDAHRWLSRRAFGALPLSAIAQKAIGLASDPR